MDGVRFRISPDGMVDLVGERRCGKSRPDREQGRVIGCMIETSVLVSAAAHLAELADHLDIDGNLLITNDPFAGVTAEKGILTFACAKEKRGLRASPHG